MMLACDELRVVPVTIHIAVSDVPELSTVRTFSRKVCSFVESRSGILALLIRVSRYVASNPHAGEDGQFGSEDQSIIAPAVDQLKSAGIDAFGPLSADTLFHARHETPMTVYSACITIRF